MKPPVGYLINKEDGLYGERGEYFDYVLSGSGVFIEAEGDLMAARIPISRSPVRGLAELRPKVVLRHGPIPVALLHRAISKMQQDPGSEYYAAVSLGTSGYELRFPAQFGEKAKVEYAVPEGRIILDLHSHGSMKAFFSPTDDTDEQALRIYGVVGNLPGAPLLRLRVGVYGYFMAVDTGIFDWSPFWDDEETRLVKILKFWRW